VTGLTLDTGALIALERRDLRVIALVTAARKQQRAITVPAPVVVEWWRGQRGPVARLLESFDVEPLDDELAHVAGMALSHASKGPSVTDAVVMASAAVRGDTVLTGDIEDLTKLQSVFPAVRLLRI
jgi:predicted nucleic acid-binding protein